MTQTLLRAPSVNIRQSGAKDQKWLGICRFRERAACRRTRTQSGTHRSPESHMPFGQALIVPCPPGRRWFFGMMQCFPSNVVFGGQLGLITCSLGFGGGGGGA